jgi:DUF971 family protein
MSHPVPSELNLAPSGLLRIVWSDGVEQLIPPISLRRACPCARCRAQSLQPPAPANTLPVLAPAEARPMSIQKMVPIGNYAYGVEFSDGHNTGIYSYEYLRKIGDTGRPSSAT